MTLVYSSDVFLEHDTGNHPETKRRLQAFTSALTQTPIPGATITSDIAEVEPGSLLRVHAPQVIDAIKNLCEHGGGALDADTVVSSASYRVALAAAGASVAAVDKVMSGQHRNALCLLRPPGHHATRQQSMGFCLFNNVAVAAQHAIDRHKAERVLIVDWDVHHGNGTQDIFYERGDVTFFSIHRFPFYPGTGSADEKGRGQGYGTTINLPIRFGTSRSDYLTMFSDQLTEVAAKAKPDIILISVGFDAHAADPIGNLGLATEDYAVLTQCVMEIATAHCQGRIVSCLEGGYNPAALTDSLLLHLKTLCSAQVS